MHSDISNILILQISPSFWFHYHCKQSRLCSHSPLFLLTTVLEIICQIFALSEISVYCGRCANQGMFLWTREIWNCMEFCQNQSKLILRRGFIHLAHQFKIDLSPCLKRKIINYLSNSSTFSLCAEKIIVMNKCL